MLKSRSIMNTLCMMALMAYGLELAAMKRLALFVLLSAALGSVAMGSAALSAAGNMRSFWIIRRFIIT